MDNDKDEKSDAEIKFEMEITKKRVHQEILEAMLEKVDRDEAIILFELDEVEQIIHDLKKTDSPYSNDEQLDMIVDKVQRYTNDDKLKKLIKMGKIANIQVFTGAHAHQRLPDGSYYTDVSQIFLDVIRQVSDIAACLFIQDVINLKPIHMEVLLNYMYALVEALEYRESEMYVPEYGNVQCCMKIIDDNLNEPFSDLLIYYGREIYEMAMAYIIGHEIGHHYLGHTEKNNINQCYDYLGKEYAADQFGLKFSLEYMWASIRESDEMLSDNYKYIHEDVRYRILGVFVALISSRIYSKDSVIETKKHPSLQNRKEKVWEYINSCFDEQIVGEVKDKVKAVEDIITNMNELIKILGELDLEEDN